MNIVIAGAGDVGYHLAELLAQESQNIVLIDRDQDVLDVISNRLDVLTICGDCASLDVLQAAEVHKANLYLGVTTSEKTNLISAILAKKMGASITVARVQNQEYITKGARDDFSDLGIDSVICPTKLAALEIQKLIHETYFTDVFDFEGGKMSVVGLTLEACSPLKNKSLRELRVSSVLNGMVRPIAILRNNETILPEGSTTLQENDHVFFMTNNRKKLPLKEYIGKENGKIQRIMIVGGGNLTYLTAKVLEKDFSVTIVEKNKDRCNFLAENLNNTLIINGDPSNMDLLEEEGLDNMDAFLALTPNSETNIITSLSAKNHGVFKTIAQVENSDYVHISQNIGVDTLINKKLIAANNIFRFIRKGKVEEIVSLKGVDAEIIEFEVHRDNQITNNPISELPLPKSAIVGGVVRDQKGLIPDGDFQLAIGDKVIVFAMPETIPVVEQLFR